jgi:Na+/H+ antiporter NhaC
MLRKVLSNWAFIHLLVLLGFLALAGLLFTSVSWFILFVALSFTGAICGAFIKVIDTIKEKK